MAFRVRDITRLHSLMGNHINVHKLNAVLPRSPFQKKQASISRPLVVLLNALSWHLTHTQSKHLMHPIWYMDAVDADALKLPKCAILYEDSEIRHKVHSDT